jgi:drug/metabolite transporter (DMT)-like permease
MYLLAIGLGLAVAVLNWATATAALRNATGGGNAAPVALAATILVSLLIPLLLWYFVTRRRSNVARWLVAVLTAFGVAVIALAAARGTLQPGLAGAIGILGMVLRVLASVQLFRADAAAWFEEPEEASA